MSPLWSEVGLGWAVNRRLGAAHHVTVLLGTSSWDVLFLCQLILRGQKTLSLLGYRCSKPLSAGVVMNEHHSWRVTYVRGLALAFISCLVGRFLTICVLLGDKLILHSWHTRRGDATEIYNCKGVIHQRNKNIQIPKSSQNLWTVQA